VLVFWFVALGALVHQDMSRSAAERLADVALRIDPGNVFYAVEQDGRHVGWASLTVDTVADTLLIREELVANVNAGGTLRREATRSDIALSRKLALRRVTTEREISGRRRRTAAVAANETTLVFTTRDDAAPSRAREMVAGAQVLVPTVVPLIALLEKTPKVGRSGRFRVFDPTTTEVRELTTRIVAESTIVVSDSARLDSTGRWVSAHEEPVRVWNLAADDGSTAWVDAHGHIVMTTRRGLTLRQRAYELAFENWRLDTRGTVIASGDSSAAVYGSTALAAGLHPVGLPFVRFEVRIGAPSLAGFTLGGGRQRVAGNRVTVEREQRSSLTPIYGWPPRADHFQKFRDVLAVERHLQRTPVLARRAREAAGTSRDPRMMASNILQWVFENLEKGASTSAPDAAQTLMDLRGDCNEHAMLYTALARAVGIPARTVAGLLYVDGAFHYHAWPEVYLGDWVAVDPLLGQFPADAGHIRLVVGNLADAPEMARNFESLRVEILNAQ
jgi:hypothetical protein